MNTNEHEQNCKYQKIELRLIRGFKTLRRSKMLKLLKFSKGFTVIELLAVTTLLSSLSTSAYVGAKNKAYEVKCQSNLRQIGLAVKMFELSNGRLPEAKFYPEEPNKDPKSIKVILKNYGVSEKLFICPTYPPELKKKGLTYLWNDQLSGKRLSRIKNPAKVWMMVDLTAALEGISSHRQGYNILYADCHVEWSPNSPILEPKEVKNDQKIYAKRNGPDLGRRKQVLPVVGY